MTEVDSSRFAGVFDIDPDAFATMLPKRRRELTQKAAYLSLHIVSKAFEETSADWVVVGGIPPRVLASGDAHTPFRDDDIYDLGEQVGAVPFFHSRAELFPN